MFDILNSNLMVDWVEEVIMINTYLVIIIKNLKL